MPPTNVIIDVDYTKIQEEMEPYQFCLTAEVTRTELITPYIYVFERDTKGDDTFCAVATPQQLSQFQSNTPAAGQTFFLLDRLELKFDTMGELNTVFTALEKDTQQLVDDYKKLLDENLINMPTFTVTYTGC